MSEWMSYVALFALSFLASTIIPVGSDRHWMRCGAGLRAAIAAAEAGLNVCVLANRYFWIPAFAGMTLVADLRLIAKASEMAWAGQSTGNNC